MTIGLFRIRTPGGGVRLARGDVDEGPAEVLVEPAELSHVIGDGAVEEVLVGLAEGPVPAGSTILAPARWQEVWAAGVTYLRSRVARGEEARDATPYDLVYEADRPELFFKSVGWRARGPGQPVAIRADSDWNAPEPELTLVLDRDIRIVGYTIGNDMSSRSIEGENPLYLPQAKVYDGSLALGPALVPASAVLPPFAIRMTVSRDGTAVFEGETSTERMKRSFEELATHLGRALSLPGGALLLTGTGIVPDADFTLHPGDVVRIEVDGLGVLENPVQEVGVRDG